MEKGHYFMALFSSRCRGYTFYKTAFDLWFVIATDIPKQVKEMKTFLRIRLGLLKKFRRMVWSLELRQYKNDSIQSKKILNYEIAGVGKSASI